LAQQIEKAEPIPATKINMSVDSEGFDINPRRTKVLIENALLTGNKFTDLQFTVHQDPNVRGFNRGGFITFVDGELNVDNDKAISTLNPFAIKQVFEQDQNILQSILRETSLTVTSFERKIRLTGESELGISAPDEISTKASDEISEGIASGDITNTDINVLPNGDVEITLPDGSKILLSNEEFRKVLGDALSQITELEGFNDQLLGLIEALQAQLKGGRDITDILGLFFNLMAELFGQQEEIKRLEGEQPEVPTDIFSQIQAFFLSIWLSILALFGVR